MQKKYNTFLKIGLFITAIILFANKMLGNKPTLIQKSLIVGDSHAVGIGSRIKNAITDPLLAHGGWRVSDLIKALNNYPNKMDITKVIISIGTNGQFYKGDNVSGLVTLLKQKFPNAKLYIYGGSYGWSVPKDKTILENLFNAYYKRFKDLGVTMLNNKLGFFTTDAAAHSVTSNSAKALINEINNLVK